MSAVFQTILENALWLFLGGLVGGLAILALWWTVQRMRPDTDRDSVVGLHTWGAYLLRLAVVAGFLVWAARQGTGPLLWAFVGVMVGRWAAIPWLSQRNAGCTMSVRWPWRWTRFDLQERQPDS